MCTFVIVVMAILLLIMFISAPMYHQDQMKKLKDKNSSIPKNP